MKISKLKVSAVKEKIAFNIWGIIIFFKVFASKCHTIVIGFFSEFISSILKEMLYMLVTINDITTTGL